MKKRQLQIFVLIFIALLSYGAYLSYETKETKQVVIAGVAAKDSTITVLRQEKKEAVQVAVAAKQEVAKVADSVAVVIQKQEEVIDSLTHTLPNEKLAIADADADDPTTVERYLSEYRPDTLLLADGSKIY